MQAIGIVPGEGHPRLVERPEPAVATPDGIRLRVRRVGICGTDREEAAGGRALAPPDAQELVIGHEMLGEVTDVGDAVTRVRPGDLAVFTVRRGCGKCTPCIMGRSDMCLTGEYRERGIWGLDGYQTEVVTDREAYVVRVPPELEALAVLCEPLSVAEKAIDEAVRIQQARLPDAAVTPEWLFGRRCVVAGLGPIGLLAALVLRLRGAEVTGLDVVDADSARPRWLAGIGGRYVDGRTLGNRDAFHALGPAELIVEAAGVSQLDFNLLDALALDGAYVLTGIPGGNRPLQIPGDLLIRQLVLGNQLLFGSVNAARGHFQMAIDDLAHAHAMWGDHVAGLVTHRYPHTDFATALGSHPAGEIKAVVEWTR